MPHDLPVLAGAGLGFIGIDDEVARARVALGHEGPFEAGREAGAAAPAQPRAFDLVDDPVVALVDQRLGVVPGATGTSPSKLPVVEAVEVAEDAVLVSEHCRPSVLSAVGPPLPIPRPRCTPRPRPRRDQSLQRTVPVQRLPQPNSTR